MLRISNLIVDGLKKIVRQQRIALPVAMANRARTFLDGLRARLSLTIHLDLFDTSKNKVSVLENADRSNSAPVGGETQYLSL